MRIDWHVHINDPKYAGLPWWQHPVPMSLENALEAHRLAALDRTVISNAVHYLRFCKTRKEVNAALESSNRYLAKCRDQHPDKFVAMATCVDIFGLEIGKEHQFSAEAINDVTVLVVRRSAIVSLAERG